MSARSLPAVSRANRTRAAAPAAAALTAAACLLLVGCSGGPATTSGSPSAAGAVSKPRAVPAEAPVPAGASGQPAHLTVLPPPAGLSGRRPHAPSCPPPAGQAIIYPASLTVRAGDVRAASGRAAQLAGAAGGYVSSETARFSRRHPADGTILIQLKIPVARYR